MQKALRGANEHFYSKSRSSRNKIVCDHVSLCNSKQLYPLLSNLITWKPPRHALFFSTKSLILRMIITFCDPNLNMIFLWKIKILRSLLYLNRSEGSNFVNFFFMKNKLQDNIYFLTVLIDKKVISFYQILKRWNVQIFPFYLRWYYSKNVRTKLYLRMVEYFRESLASLPEQFANQEMNLLSWFDISGGTSIPSITYKSFNPVSVFLKSHDLISPYNLPQNWGRLESMIRIHLK